jgi:hypothetical protein
VLLDGDNRMVAGPIEEVPGPDRPSSAGFPGRVPPPRAAAAGGKPEGRLGD